MKKHIKILLKNIIYTFMSNAASFIINALVVLIIPKIIGVSDYGYYQLYVLLATYALYFHFGWCDGIYLRYVGENYNCLDKEKLSSQFKGICIMSFFLLIALLVIIHVSLVEPNKTWIYTMTAIVVLIVTPKTFTSIVMQMTNKMKEYSLIVLIEKAVYVVILIIMLAVGIRDFKILILSDVLGKVAALILGIYFCKDIIFRKVKLKRAMTYCKEAEKNIKVGFFLLLSNLSSILITGIVQFSVEEKWDIETFSKVSLTFNMSKMLLVVITAMSIVLVPMLKHMNNKQLANIYKEVRSVLMFVLGAMLIFYYPIKTILLLWLPQYALSMQYLALLFPMCLFESKTSLLINTYLKAMREERKLCLVNVITVLISAAVAFVTVFIMDNLNAAILSIPYLLAFRCILLEFYIGRKLGLHLMKDAIMEVILSTFFVSVSWYINSWLSTILYSLAYGIYVMSIRKNLSGTIKRFIIKT